MKPLIRVCLCIQSVFVPVEFFFVFLKFCFSFNVPGPLLDGVAPQGARLVVELRLHQGMNLDQVGQDSCKHV